MFIQKSDLFKEVDKEVIQEIDKIKVEESHPKGTVLFVRGETANELYVLKNGRVDLAIGEEDQVAYVVKKPGEAFGWSSLVNHHVYTASAICSSQCQLIKMNSDQLNRIFERNPASGLLFFKRLAEIISKRVATGYNLLHRSHERTSKYLRSVGSI